MLQSLFPSLNFQTLSLLAIVAGLVVVCMGIWYIWSMQQQMQTDMQYLQMQQKQLAASGAAASTAAASGTAASTTSANGVPASASTDASAGVNHVTTSTDDISGLHSEATSVLHRSVQLSHAASGLASGSTGHTDGGDESDADNSVDGDEAGDTSCDSDYDDDDQAVAADTAVEADPTSDKTGSAAHSVTVTPTDTGADTGADTAADAVAGADDTGVAVGTVDAGLVESLLSNMVTESIDQMLPAGSATMTMAGAGGVGVMVVETVSAEDSFAVPTEAPVTIEEFTIEELDAATVCTPNVEDGNTAGAVAPVPTPVADAPSVASTEDFLDCQGDPVLLGETLRLKTVAELKQLCGTYAVGIKKGKGGYKRKDELIEDLVGKVCVGANAAA